MKIRKPIVIILAVLMISALIPCTFASAAVEILPAQVISDAETDTGLVVSQLPSNSCWANTCYNVKINDDGIAFINVMVQFPDIQKSLTGTGKELGITIARVIIAQDPLTPLDEVSAEAASVELQDAFFLDSTREITLPNGAKAYVTPNPTFGHLFNTNTGSYEKSVPDGIYMDVKTLKTELRDFVKNILCLDEFKSLLKENGTSESDIDYAVSQIDSIVKARKISLSLGTNNIINVPTVDDDGFWKSETNDFWKNNGDKYWDTNIRDFRGCDDNSHWPPQDVPFWEFYEYN